MVVRRPVPADRDEFVALRAQSADFHAPWITPAPPAPDGHCDYGFSRWCVEPGDPRRVTAFVCRRDDGAIAGGIALSEIVRGDFQSAYCGYWVGAPHARQGLMTEGLGIVLDHAFGRLGLHRVEANIQPGNEPSIALVRRLGFRREGLSLRYLRINGRWCDHERWAITAEEWR